MTLSVLVVEDDRALGDVTAYLLAAAGFRPALARTAQEARALHAVAAYAVVVIDLRLPDGDGDRLAAEFRAAGSRAHLIGWTAAPETLAPCRVATFDRLLPKPLEPAAFLAVLRALA